MAPTVVAITGFTGMFGRQVTDSLLKHDSVKIHGIVRDKSKVPKELESDNRISLFEADSSDGSSLQKALRGADVCICSYNGPPSLMIDGQRTLIDACIAESVPRYVASDYSFDIRGLRMGDFPFKDFQLKTRDYLAEREKEGKIKPVHILNGAFTEVIISEALGIIDASTDTFSYWNSGDEKWEMTSVPDAASFVALAALDKDATGFIAVRGDTKSINEIAEIYKKVYGVDPKMKNLGSMDELKGRMISLREAEPDNVMKWLGLHYNYFTLNGSTLLNEKDLGRYPAFKASSLEDVMRGLKKEELKTALYG